MPDKEPVVKTMQQNFKSSKFETRVINGSDVFSFFKILILLIFAVSLIRVLSNSEVVTLRGLLQLLSDSPTIPLDWIKYTNLSVSWGGLLKPIATFINTIMDVVSFALFISVAAANVVLYAIYFVRWLFL